MSLKKLIMLLLVLGVGLVIINNDMGASELQTQSETELATTIENIVDETTFEGSIIISKNIGDSYELLYADGVGSQGGYDIDTIYDVGSVSKLYTTVAIMQLVESGDLSYDDTLPMFFEDVPEDKAQISIAMLLTHTSGINVSENEDHTYSKQQEIKRIMESEISFEPGSNYKYANSGYTLLAAIIEEVSGKSYEVYMDEAIFTPLGLSSTGFPGDADLNSNKAVEGTLDGENYGNVTNFEYGWWSKGYTDILTTPRELTYFFQALISGKLLGDKSIEKLITPEVNLGSDNYRGYGTDIKYPNTEDKIIGHTGIWYGGNTAVYYRPSDGILLTLACDQLNVAYDLPANAVFNQINANYPVGSYSDFPAIDSVEVKDLNQEQVQLPSQFTKQMTNTSTRSALTPLEQGQLAVLNIIQSYRLIIIVICILLCVIISHYLIVRIQNK